MNTKGFQTSSISTLAGSAVHLGQRAVHLAGAARAAGSRPPRTQPAHPAATRGRCIRRAIHLEHKDARAQLPRHARRRQHRRVHLDVVPKRYIGSDLKTELGPAYDEPSTWSTKTLVRSSLVMLVGASIAG